MGIHIPNIERGPQVATKCLPTTWSRTLVFASFRQLWPFATYRSVTNIIYRMTSLFRTGCSWFPRLCLYNLMDEFPLRLGVFWLQDFFESYGPAPRPSDLVSVVYCTSQVPEFGICWRKNLGTKTHWDSLGFGIRQTPSDFQCTSADYPQQMSRLDPHIYRKLDFKGHADLMVELPFSNQG